MKILPYTTSYNPQFSSTKLPVARPISRFVPDTFELCSNQVPPFKAITLKTLEKLYKADFPPITKDYGKYCYPAYVFDKVTGEPVVVVIKPLKIQPDYEFYKLYRDVGDSDLKLIGLRFHSIDSGRRLISDGYMTAEDKTISGGGAILQWLAFARMKMLGYDNIEILSTHKAYGFHNACGFEKITDDGELAGRMRLSPEAISDWEKFEQKHQLFAGKKFPSIL